jgi:hypothetical protein
MLSSLVRRTAQPGNSYQFGEHFVKLCRTAGPFSAVRAPNEPISFALA